MIKGEQKSPFFGYSEWGGSSDQRESILRRFLLNFWCQSDGIEKNWFRAILGTRIFIINLDRLMDSLLIFIFRTDKYFDFSIHEIMGTFVRHNYPNIRLRREESFDSILFLNQDKESQILDSLLFWK